MHFRREASGSERGSELALRPLIELAQQLLPGGTT